MKGLAKKFASPYKKFKRVRGKNRAIAMGIPVPIKQKSVKKSQIELDLNINNYV